MTHDLSWPSVLASSPLLVYENRALEIRDAYATIDRLETAARVSSAPEPQKPRRYTTRDGVAIVPIMGALVSKGDYYGVGSPYTSYNSIAHAYAQIAADPSVTRIVNHISSPGGTVDGIMGASAAIRAARASGKPVTAFVDGMAASGGYWLAAQSDEIVLADDLALVGSIGVYTLHADISNMLAQYGVNISLIKSGESKADGHPFGPLEARARASIQAEVNDLRLFFANEVAAGRPKLSAKAALATEAGVFRGFTSQQGKDAISMKLADRVATLDDVISKPSKTMGMVISANAFDVGKAAAAAILAERPKIQISASKPQPTERSLRPSVVEGQREKIKAGWASALAQINSLKGFG